jgi:hypothetical protein
MASEHWFERYREAYRAWWQKAPAQLDEEDLEEFEEFRQVDQLTPLTEEQLRTLVEQFPGLPEIHFPDHYDDYSPPSYRILTLEEARERVTSIQRQADFELEQLSEMIDCDAHGEDHDQCRTLLTAVRDDPWRFYPFLDIWLPPPNDRISAPYRAARVAATIRFNFESSWCVRPLNREGA